MKKLFLLFVLSIVFITCADAQCTSIISTIAGTDFDYDGNGGPAITAGLSSPSHICGDSHGNIYIADLGHHCIRKVDTNGIITRFAGTGAEGFGGDGGPATAALFAYPISICIDPSDNIYVADFGTNRIRKINASGIVTTIAGNGEYGNSGDGGPATAATMNFPRDVCADHSGNIYFSDEYNYRIRKVSAAGVITTVAGGGTDNPVDGGQATNAVMYDPSGVAVDAAGDVYIADNGYYEIYKVHIATGVVSIVAGIESFGYSGDGGPATMAELGLPGSITLDTAGNLFITDRNHHRLRKVATTGIITTIGGNGGEGYSGDGGPATAATLGMLGVYADRKGNVFVADDIGNRVRKIDRFGVISRFAGNGDQTYTGMEGAATLAKLWWPRGVSADHSGNIYFAEQDRHQIAKIDASGIITHFAGTGESGFAGDGGQALGATLYGPSGTCTDLAGNVYIADVANHRIRKISISGIITTVAGTGTEGFSGDGGPATAAKLSEPDYVCTDSSGNLFIADKSNHRVRKVNASGIITTVAGNGSEGVSADGGPATGVALTAIGGICTDRHNNLFIADNANNKIRKVSASGIITTVAGNGSSGAAGDHGPATAAQLQAPNAICIDGADNLYIAESYASRVRKVDASGIITKFAGGTFGFSGDGGPATAAALDVAIDICMYGSDDLLIVDLYNQRIRKVNLCPPVTVGIISGSLAVCEGTSTFLSDTSAPGTWSSSNTDVAYIDAETGELTGMSAGTAVITYTLPSLDFAVAVLTVNAIPSVAAITGTLSTNVGWGTMLADATPGGTWTGSNPSVAVVYASGLVFGIDGGTTRVTYTVSNSCGTGYSTAIVTVNPVADESHYFFTPHQCETIVNGFDITLYAQTGDTIWMEPQGVPGTEISHDLVNWHGYSSALYYIYTGPEDFFTEHFYYRYHAPDSIGLTYKGEIDYDNLTSEHRDGNYNGSIAYIHNLGTLPLQVSNNGPACMGGAVTLSTYAGTGISYAWSGPAGFSATNAAPVVSSLTAGMFGTYSVTITAGWGCTASGTTTVTAAAATTAGTITGTAEICAGTSATYTGTVSGGVWGSGNTSVATVSAAGLVSGVAGGTATISYTKTGICGTATATKIVTVSPVANAGTITGAATVMTGAGTTLSATVSGGVWSAGNSNATVSSSGTVTGVAAGSVVISYSVTNSCGTAVATKTVTVTAGSTGDITGTLTICPGTTSALSSAASGGTWSSSTPSVATINSSTGVVTGVSAGTARITYAYSTFTVNAVVTVNPLPAAITGGNSVCLGATTTLANATTGGSWSSNNTAIATIGAGSGLVSGIATGSTLITYTAGTGCYRTLAMTVKPLPAAITGTAMMCVGASATYTDATTGGLSWTSSNTSVATIGATSGVVNAITPGTATITFTLISGCTATKVLTVNSLPAPITGVATVCAGSTTLLSDADGGGSWSSSTSAVATIGSAGNVAGIAAGVTNIIYSLGAGCTRSLAITVNPLPAVITGLSTLCAGTTATLADATTGGIWTSATPSVATISASGVVSGLSAGTSIISYTNGSGCARTVTITVSGVISPSTGTPVTCVGSATTLTNSTTGGTWSSSNGVVAPVSAGGVVTGAAAGTSNITYSLGAGCATVTQVTVNAGVSAITGTPSVCIGSTTGLANAAGGGTWSSSNAALATIGATGIVTGIAPGTPTITYTLASGCYRTQAVTVKALPAAIAGNAGLCVGSTTILTNSGTGTSWTSSTTSVATIGATSGVVAGISAGTTTMTFTATTGCTATRVVTVDAVPSVLPITGPSAVAIGGTITMSDATTGGVWSSNSTARATVSAGGVVTGVSAPAATISYTVTNGVCIVAATKGITVTMARPGIAESMGIGSTLSVYPNPTSGMFTAQSAIQGVLTICTLEGKTVQQYAVSTGANNFRLPDGIAAGVYLCRFSGADGSSVMVRLVYEP